MSTKPFTTFWPIRGGNKDVNSSNYLCNKTSMSFYKKTYVIALLLLFCCYFFFKISLTVRYHPLLHVLRAAQFSK